MTSSHWCDLSSAFMLIKSNQLPGKLCMRLESSLGKMSHRYFRICFLCAPSPSMTHGCLGHQSRRQPRQAASPQQQIGSWILHAQPTDIPRVRNGAAFCIKPLPTISSFHYHVGEQRNPHEGRPRRAYITPQHECSAGVWEMHIGQRQERPTLSTIALQSISHLKPHRPLLALA
jgi:hypothetical protein